MSHHLKQRLLSLVDHEKAPLGSHGILPPGDLSVPGMDPLNPPQQAAIREALTKPLSLIQGPPGTGKTVTCAAIVYNLIRIHGDAKRVLVCAPSNVAVDHLALKIAATGVRVVRVVARSREFVEEKVHPEVIPLTLNYQCQNADVTQAFQLRELLERQGKGRRLAKAQMAEMTRLRRQLERMVMESAQVVCCTCATAGSTKLFPREVSIFEHVLIDEATQACEPECLIPMMRGAKQVVLVGDHCQLGPVIVHKGAAQAGLSLSLYERLIFMQVRPARLLVQYRMHPFLSTFPSNTFYEGTLQNGVGPGARGSGHPHHEAFPWPDATSPALFLVSHSAEELGPSGTSYLNRGEAQSVERVVTRLLMSHVAPEEIGVITPYDGQRNYVKTVLTRTGPLAIGLYKKIEVASVDAFQGREKDYIILSCVRSNERQGIGFLREPRRLNVALTRAKRGIIIIGNPRVLARHPLWGSLLTFLEGTVSGCVREGTLTALRPATGAFMRQRVPFTYAPNALRMLEANEEWKREKMERLEREKREKMEKIEGDVLK